MSFPYLLYREDHEAAPELKVGWHLKIGEKFYKVKGIRPWKVGHTYAVNALATLRVDYLNTESANVNPGTGVAQRTGYSGNVDTKLVRQTKYIAFGTVQAVTLWWGSEPYPKEATVVLNATWVPVQSPLTLNRFSYHSSMYFNVRVTAGAVATTIQVFFAMVEYDIEGTTLASGDIYRLIDENGFLSEPRKL